MDNNGGNSDRRVARDEVWPGLVQWDLGLAANNAPVLWKCDAMRAGQLYNRMIFNTQQEAQDFARRMRDVEPDQMFNVEQIKASTVWN